jgi:hypothetical protein
VDAVLDAVQVRLVGGRLALYNSASTRLGLFARSQEFSQLPEQAFRLPGRVPTEADVVGNWLGPIEDGADQAPPPFGVGTLKTVMTFEHHDVVVTLPNATSLSWYGYDGCNWGGGFVHLAADGSFRTSGNGSTLRGCLRPGRSPVTAVDLVKQARLVRLIDGRLQFYDATHHLLGTLRFLPGVVN